MKLSKALADFAEHAEADDIYWVERAKLDFSQELEKQRHKTGMTYAAIAKKIGTSAPYISKVFRGDANLTIESMVKLARSTGGRINIEVVDEKADASPWVFLMRDVPKEAANHPSMRTATAVSLSSGYARDIELRAA